jgi:hypothetical protein
MDDKQITELAEWASKPTFAEAKVVRQRQALDFIVRRNTSLRFALKVHEHLHGPLSRDEWAAARTEVASEAHRERIAAEPVSA